MQESEVERLAREYGIDIDYAALEQKAFADKLRRYCEDEGAFFNMKARPNLDVSLQRYADELWKATDGGGASIRAANREKAAKVLETPIEPESRPYFEKDNNKSIHRRTSSLPSRKFSDSQQSFCNSAMR